MRIRKPTETEAMRRLVAEEKARERKPRPAPRRRVQVVHYETQLTFTEFIKQELKGENNNGSSKHEQG